MKRVWILFFEIGARQGVSSVTAVQERSKLTDALLIFLLPVSTPSVQFPIFMFVGYAKCRPEICCFFWFFLFFVHSPVSVLLEGKNRMYIILPSFGPFPSFVRLASFALLLLLFSRLIHFLFSYPFCFISLQQKPLTERKKRTLDGRWRAKIPGHLLLPGMQRALFSTCPPPMFPLVSVCSEWNKYTKKRINPFLGCLTLVYIRYTFTLFLYFIRFFIVSSNDLSWVWLLKRAAGFCARPSRSFF